MSTAESVPGPKLLDPLSTAAVIFGAHDWTEAGLTRAPAFLRSAKGVLGYLIDSAGLGLDPTLVLDLFDDTAAAGDQLARARDTLDVLLRERRDEGRPVTDVLIYYVGHGYTDDQNHLSLMVRRSRRGMEAETGIKAPDLARVLRIAAPQQRRMIVLDCCFSEAAARAFIGQAGAFDQAVAATAVKDLKDDAPLRGTLLLCSSPVGEVSMGAPNAARTLFTGAVLEVLRQGAEGRPPILSFADLRDAAYQRMVASFGANAPRPVLHQANAAQGDLTRTPAFPNRSLPRPLAENDVQLASRREDEGDDQEAVRLYRRAADQGSAAAQTRLAVMYINGKGGLEKSEREAVRLFRLAADQGAAAAQYNLGVMYENGRGGLGKDEREAARLYRLAADRGAADARYNLGVMYATGQGALEKDEREAARLYRLAADQGNADAQYSLALMYEDGLGGLEKDEREAARLYRLAADQGDPDAQYNLGVMYANGEGGLEKDEGEAARLYRLAADQGKAHARHNLANMYASGRGGLEKDEREAARLYRLAADQGDAGAQYSLGAMYGSGRGGLEKDEHEAVRLYRLAADQGDAYAQYALGLMHANGRGGLEKDDREAARLHRLAADQGNANAQYSLGALYENGRGGLKKDLREAVRWYRKAAQSGQVQAKDRLEALTKTS